ncbi:MAG: hypothetical protein Q9163_002968 [Psora crenata]
MAEIKQKNGLAKFFARLDMLEWEGKRLRRRAMPLEPLSAKNAPTEPSSPEPSKDEQLRRDQEWEQKAQQQTQFSDETDASIPQIQFLAQVAKETKRIWNVNPFRSGWKEGAIPSPDIEEKEAMETVKKRWVEQGIWKDEWDKVATGSYQLGWKWKHEEPLELESESETDTEAESPPPPQAKFRRPKSHNKRRQIAERRAVREREREASRPYHQFLYQISKERKQIHGEFANWEIEAPDINTMAYENVKDTWTNRGIWDGRWGILPGMLWKHELHPAELNQMFIAIFVPANSQAANGRYSPVQSPNVRLSGPPSPVTSNHRQTFSIMNTSEQRPSAEVDPARLESGDTGRSPSAASSPRTTIGKRVLRSTTKQLMRPNERKPSPKDGQNQPVANISLGPIHPSKVSKVAGEKKARPRRRPNPQRVSSDGSPLPSGVDAVEAQPSPDRPNPCRRKRTQPPVLNVANDLARTACTDPSTKPGRRSARNLSTKSSAKPQGISKGQPPKTARAKARKI